MKKYYIGLAILMLGAISLVIVTLSQGKSAKLDREAQQKAGSIGTTLDDYINSKGDVPDSLSEAGIKDVPPTITYKKVDASKYKLCVEFSRDGNIYDAGWSSIFSLGYRPSSADNDATISGEASYYASYKLYNHKKGENCQTVKPYIYNSTNSGVNLPNSKASSCGDADSSYTIKGQASVKSIDGGATGTITFDTTGQTLTDTSKNTSLTAVSSKKFDEITVFCGADGKKTTASSVKTGQKVTFYMYDVDSGYVEKIQL